METCRSQRTGDRETLISGSAPLEEPLETKFALAEVSFVGRPDGARLGRRSVAWATGPLKVKAQAFLNCLTYEVEHKPLARVALRDRYNGSPRAGKETTSRATGQEQAGNRSGQVAACRFRVMCAGRTDAGVHGLMQVVLDTAIDATWRLGFGDNAFCRGHCRPVGPTGPVRLSLTCQCCNPAKMMPTLFLSLRSVGVGRSRPVGWL
jgi:hypothetical protein